MFFFFYFLTSFLSAILVGQDPYAILGVTRHATQEEIRKAFRAKTRKFHPDKNKEPNAEKKWVQINDAYELLKDPVKKARFDNYGLVDESLTEQPKGPNRADKIKTILAQDLASRSMDQRFGEFDYKKRNDVVTQITDETFSALTRDGRPWLIYAYETEDHRHKNILEDLFRKTGFLFGIGSIKVSKSPQTARLLSIKTTPRMVLYDPRDQKATHFSGELTLRSVTKFASQKFGAEVTIVHDDAEIWAWRKTDLDRLHVILFSDLPDVPSSFEIVAAFLPRNAVFAFASINQINLPKYPRAIGSLTLDELPTYIVYRMGDPKDDTFGGPVIPIVAPMELDAGSLSAIIRRYNYPVFCEINANNFNRLSSEFIIIFISCENNSANCVEIAEDIRVGVNNMNIPTGIINGSKENDFVNYFSLEAGDFIVIKPKTKQYTIWKEITTWMAFNENFELMQNRLITFKKYNELPNLTQSVEMKAIKKQIEFNEKMRDLRFMFDEKMDDFLLWMKKIPVIFVILLLSISLILIGEIVMCIGSKCCSCCLSSTKTVHIE